MQSRYFALYTYIIMQTHSCEGTSGQHEFDFSESLRKVLYQGNSQLNMYEAHKICNYKNSLSCFRTRDCKAICCSSSNDCYLSDLCPTKILQQRDHPGVLHHFSTFSFLVARTGKFSVVIAHPKMHYITLHSLHVYPL